MSENNDNPEDFVTYQSFYYTPSAEQQSGVMSSKVGELNAKEEGDVVLDVQPEGVFKYEAEVIGSEMRDEDEEGKFTAYEIKVRNLLNNHEYYVFRRYSEFSVMHQEVCL
jgi:hypothetical protein